MRKYIFISFIIFIATFIACYIAAMKLENDEIYRHKQAATNLAVNMAYSIQNQLNTNLSATSALAVIVKNYKKIDNFDSLAKELLEVYSGISSLQLAPKGYVTYIYPMEGNEKAIGDLLTDPKRKKEALAAISSRKLTLAGPYNLRQGGIGIIGRYPIFIDSSGRDTFWGFATVVIKLDELLLKSALNSLDSSDYHYKIWRMQPNTNEPEIILTNNQTKEWKDEIDLSFNVPNGKWFLSIQPKDEWYIPRIRLLIFISALLFAAFVAILRYISYKHSYINKQNAKMLAELNASKDKFFSIIAHDLKNPLGNLRETTKMLHSSYYQFDEEERFEFIELMKSSADNLYELLWNLLEWSRSQRGVIPFIPVEIQLHSLINNCFSLIKPIADAKDIKLINSIDKDLSIDADINMINTVLSNLLTNAIKFTPNNGSIEIACSEDSDKYYTFYIKDTGIGISVENLEKLFKIDENVSTLGTAGEKGTGLGLILCKEFIEKHNGKIWVESQIGIGSRFYISLPKRKI